MKTIPAALHVPELADEPGLIHGFSTTLLGSVGLTHAPDPEPVLASRRDFMRVMGVEERMLTVAGAVHGKSVARIEEPRPLVNDVAAAAVNFMRDEYGCEHIRAGIGPGICGRCYEVGSEFDSRFDVRFLKQGPGGRRLLDLAAANRAQLDAAGVEAVYEVGICTKESYLFPSHRRHPDGKRFGAIVALR